MRILLVDSGASHSTRDVEVGIGEALMELGHTVKTYSLQHRLGIAAQWNTRIWKMRGSVPEQKPNWGDAAYRASIEALEMALRWDVDWVLSVSGRYFHPDAIFMMRKAGLKVACNLTESPYEDQGQANIARMVDLAWTNERTSIAYLRQVNPNVFYSPHAFRPTVHRPYTPEELEFKEIHKFDVVFVGTDFIERIRMLEGANWEGIDLGLVGMWTLLPSRHRLRKRLVNHLMDNEDTAKIYGRSKVGINLHRASRFYTRDSETIDYAESLNPRAFELAACGVFYISDKRKEGEEIFGDSVLTFDNPQELEGLVRLTLDDERMRKKLAEEAMERVQPYTYVSKVEQMICDLRRYNNVG